MRSKDHCAFPIVVDDASTKQMLLDLCDKHKEIIVELVESLEEINERTVDGPDAWHRAQQALAKVEARLKQTHGAEG
jgi:ankyrin repeat protein